MQAYASVRSVLTRSHAFPAAHPPCSYSPRQLSHMLWAVAKLQLARRPLQAALVHQLLARLLPTLQDGSSSSSSSHGECSSSSSVSSSSGDSGICAGGSSSRPGDGGVNGDKGSRKLSAASSRAGLDQTLLTAGNARDVGMAAWAVARLARDGLWARASHGGGVSTGGSGTAAAAVFASSSKAALDHQLADAPARAPPPASFACAEGARDGVEHPMGPSCAPACFRAVVEHLLDAAQAHASGLGPQELSNTLWALAHLARMLERASGVAGGGDEDEEDEEEEEEATGWEVEEQKGQHRQGHGAMTNRPQVWSGSSDSGDSRAGLFPHGAGGLQGEATQPMSLLVPASAAATLLPLLRGSLRGPLGRRALALARHTALARQRSTGPQPSAPDAYQAAATLDRRHVPLLAWSAARLQHRDGDLLEALAGAALVQLRSLTAHGISLLLWAYAR